MQLLQRQDWLEKQMGEMALSVAGEGIIEKKNSLPVTTTTTAKLSNWGI